MTRRPPRAERPPQVVSRCRLQRVRIHNDPGPLADRRDDGPRRLDRSLSARLATGHEEDQSLAGARRGPGQKPLGEVGGQRQKPVGRPFSPSDQIRSRGCLPVRSIDNAAPGSHDRASDSPSRRPDKNRPSISRSQAAESPGRSCFVAPSMRSSLLGGNGPSPRPQRRGPLTTPAARRRRNGSQQPDVPCPADSPLESAAGSQPPLPARALRPTISSRPSPCCDRDVREQPGVKRADNRLEGRVGRNCACRGPATANTLPSNGF